MPAPLKVSDIAQPDTTTQFISDVQLTTFYDAAKLNQDLMQRFMFTRGTGGRSDRKGTADLLQLLHQRVTPVGENQDNRFVFIATYGHGKSHFGLALANYFGAPQGSPELAAVHTKLDIALPNDQVQMLRDYRAGKAPFLVLILRGDRPGSLRDTFFQALDRALARNEQTKDLKPPFWFDRADELLERLGANPADAAVANEYLAAHNLDLLSLRTLVQERQSRAYHLSVGAFEAVHKVQPNLGGETALGDAVRWIVTELCGEGKPFGGLLILFDEFSRFIQDYIQNNPVGAPLQELLSGMGSEEARGKALFVALSQHDPNVIAERYGAGEELIKELNRLPDSNRHIMQTMLEDVLGGVLKTDEAAWKSFLSDGHIGMTVGAAADTALALFSERYGPKQLGWNLNIIMEKVAKQCFPLHPLTTAFLASVTLQSTGTVRSVLGFVQDQQGYVMPRFNESAVTEDGQPNWVLPTRLVDYFGEALGEDKYKNFKNVVKPDLTYEQQEVLKAMLLLDIAELSTKKAGGYEAVVATLTGLEEAEAKRTLKVLEEQHYIRYDSANKTYSFWVGSNDALNLDRLLTEGLQQREENGKLAQLFSNFSGGTNPVNSLGLTERHAVSVGWGHPDDWAAQEVLVPVSGLNASFLDALQLKYTVSLDKAPQARGVVVLVVPRTQKEAEEAAEKVSILLGSSDKARSAPLLFLIPQEAHPDLHQHLLKAALLEDPLFKAQAQSQVGPSAITEMSENLTARAKKTLDVLRKQSVLVLPPNIKAAWEARAKPNMANRTGEALKVVYDLAYPQHPDSFFTQYKQGSATLTKPIVDVVHVLFENKLDDVSWSVGAKVQREIVKLLQKEWKIVSPQQQVIEPEFTKVKEAWDRFEATFSPKIKGGAYAETVLRELLQPPYGYDHNTLTLIFAAWIGRNRDAISLSGFGKLNRPAPGSKDATFKKPAEFLWAMSHIEIRRKDTEGEKAKISAVLSQLKDGAFTLVEAKKASLTLQEFRENNPRYDADYLEQVNTALAKLQKGLENHTAYEKAVDAFEAKLSQAKTVTQLRPLLDMLKTGFPALSVVQSDRPTIAQLEAQVTARATKLAEAEIHKYTRLKDIGQYSMNAAGLTGLAKSLYQLGLPALKTKAEEGLAELERAKTALEISQLEAGEISVVNSISVTGSLVALRDSLAALRKVDPKSDRANELANQKYDQLKQNIAALEEQLPKWAASLDEIIDADAANCLHKELLSQTANYLGTSEAEQVTGLQVRADALSRYFSVLGQQLTLNDPADVERRRTELQALQAEFAPQLNVAQSEQMQVALTRLSEQQAQQVAQAREWLQQQQARLAAGDLRGLDKVLNAPPRFLAEPEQDALSELRTTLHAQLAGQAQEEQQLKLVRSFSVVGTVAALGERLQELEKVAPVSTSVREAAKEQGEKIKAELSRLRALPAAWQEALADATSVQTLSQLAKAVAREEGQLQGSGDEEMVAQLTRRIEAVQTTLRRAEDLRRDSSTRLRDLAERLAEQETLSQSPNLSPAQAELLKRDATQTAQQLAAETEKLDARLASAQEQLAAATSLPQLDKVELGHFPRVGLSADRQERLASLEQQREALRSLFRQLASLEQRTWRDANEADALLSQFRALQESADWSADQRELVAQKRAQVEQHLSAKGAEATAWLAGLEAALPSADAKGLGRLEQDLARPHPFLDSSEADRLEALRSALRTRLEEDQALQIETLFEKIESPERRAELLARLQQLVLGAGQ